MNVADKAAVVHVRAIDADADYIVAVVTPRPADTPKAVLAPPVVLSKRANVPLALLESPVVLFKSAPARVAVF
jgi:hypothetical protein